ncbi:FumA C-terminus/TtdB family hydratase beta subunit [Paenibacillus larvae]
MDHRKLTESILQLIIQTSTNLTSDVRESLFKAKLEEEMGTRSSLVLSTIYQNMEDARQHELPVCQDTGMITFFIHTPVGIDQIEIRECIRKAIAQATRIGKLRPNSVDSITGLNTGNNLGINTPIIHFEQWRNDQIEIKVILKGGGCENKNIQYSLPIELEGLGTAGRDLDGVRKCILHAIYQAQGQGCSAGFIGVGIGGDRTSGYECAKLQLMRSVDDANSVGELANLEDYIMEKANQLDIGMMGFGGKKTLLGCKIGAVNRIAPSFFVSVAYNCWAFRRRGVLIDPKTGNITKWQYGKKTETQTGGGTQHSSLGEAIVLNTPISKEDVRKLKVGDVVLINGKMHTGRDNLHKYLIDHDSPVDLNGGIIYHCGPVMIRDADGNWRVHAAGPTTSSREEPYQATIIKKFGIRAVVGKGGMGEKTLQALSDNGCIYLNAIGGAAQFYAKTFKKVNGVHFLDEFGVPEAMWHFETEGFIAIVTMDAHGNSLHKDIDEQSRKKLSDFKERVF